MFNGSGDFSALNMQGDISQRKTKNGQLYPENETEGENNAYAAIVYAVLALFGIGLLLDAFRELLLVIMLLSFIVDRLISTASKSAIYVAFLYSVVSINMSQ